ncbi:MAG: STAS domain-containing protein [Ardenticatenaceae bacterium]
MEINSRYSNGTIIVELYGRFDANANEAENLRTLLLKAAEALPAQVIVNLDKVNFIDSSGLAVLVQGMKRCRKNNGNLHLCNLQQRVRIIFELTRLDRAFYIFPDEKSALKAFA